MGLIKKIWNYRIKMTDKKKEQPKEFQKIEDKEKLNWLEKRAFKVALRKARKDINKYADRIKERNTTTDDLIDKIMNLTSELEIVDEVDGKEIPITKEYLKTKKYDDLLDMFEEALTEAEKLV